MRRRFQPILFTMFICFCVACGSTEKENVEKPPADSTHPKVSTTDSTLQYIMGHFEPEKHPLFVKIDSQYADRAGMYLRKEAYAAFLKMNEAAGEAGINLVIRSAARNFEYQKGIWERKWTGETLVDGEKLNETMPDPYRRAQRILRFSSMPGSSRHHWGTEIDLNSFENEWFESGEGKRIYQWLNEYAGEYGYCQVYTEKGDDRKHGYEKEKWHWSYLPIARDLTDYAEQHLKDSYIEGFKGSETADSLEIVEHYVLGIDPYCR